MVILDELLFEMLFGLKDELFMRLNQLFKLIFVVLDLHIGMVTVRVGELC